MKKKKNLEKRKLIKYSIFIIPVFLLSFYLSYHFNIGGKYVSVINQTTTTTPTTTTVKPKVKIIAAEIVKTTTTFIITNKTTTTIFIIFEKTTTTTIKSSGGGGGGSRTTTTTIPKPVAKIIINEIMYDPPGPDPGNEWLEIYNNDTFDCDISDWNFFESGTNHRLTLEKGSMIISSKGYAIIADNATNFLVNHPSFNGTAIDSTFSLSNTGEYIALKDYSLNVVDEVTYNSSWGGNETNKTLERKEDEWHESLAEGGTPGYENSVSTFVTTTTTTATTTSSSTTTSTTSTTSTSISTTTTSTTTSTTTTVQTTTTTTTTSTTIPIITDHVVISEIQANGGDADDEFIELYNPTNNSVNLSSWSIQYKSAKGTTYYKKNLENSIYAYGFFLIANKKYDGNVTPDLSHNSFQISNSGGHIFLVSNQIFLNSSTDASIIDKVGYGDADSPETLAALWNLTSHQSIERKPGYLNPNAGNWQDTDNNFEDFILRNISEPQNSNSTVEIPY